MPTRRTVLGLMAGTTAAALIPIPALASDGSYDISYLWAPDLEAVLDYRDQVAGVLGPEVARDLTVVRGRSGNWGLVYDRKGTDLAAARNVAAAHDRLLRAALGGSEALATTIKDEGYTRSHNVAYGSPTTLAEARKRFDLIARVLGPDVHRRLVIEQPEPNRYAVVYKRHGDAASTASVAARHTTLLKTHGVSARVVAERHLTPVWGAGSSDATPTVAKTSGAGGRSGGGVPVAASVGAAMTGARAASTVIAAHTAEPSPKAQPSAEQKAPPAAAPKAAPAAKSATVQAKAAPAPAKAPPVVAARPDSAAPASRGGSTAPAPEDQIAQVEPSAEQGPGAPAPVQGSGAPAPAPPGRAPSVIALPASVATPVRDAINLHVQDLRKRGLLAPDETTSWYVHALSDERTWVAINAERSLQCASMMKPYVALAYLHKVEAGLLTYDDDAKVRLAAMLQRSSNSATNWAISEVGGPSALQQLLEREYPGLFPETKIVEAIPPQGRTYKNRSSARDYVRFTRAMWRGELARSEEIKRLMGLPSRDRLVTGAPSIPAGTQVHNKTGSTSHLCGDFGVIVAKKKNGDKVPYAFVGIIEKRSRAQNYGAWVSARSAVIRSVSDLTYRQLKARYELV